MSHKHSHHHHSPKNFGRAFSIGISLNIIYIVLEAIYGFLNNSLALLADAGHNLSDVFGLIIAWIGFSLSRRPASKRFTYGLKRSSVLASLLNALLLLLAVGIIVKEAMVRFNNPVPVGGIEILWVATIGIFVNLGTALLFLRGQEDLNIRGAFLHMMADAAVTLGVLVSGAIILATQWFWLDPTISLIIAMVILWSTWGLLQESLKLSLDAVPKNIDLDAVCQFLQEIEGVNNVHDLHIWPLSTTEIALSVHLVVPDLERSTDEFLASINQHLHDHFGIEHSTIQIEHGDPDHLCSLEQCSVPLLTTAKQSLSLS